MKTYRINEMFCSPQGEGARQGDLSLFVRFTGCNMRCQLKPGIRSPGGFDCDTEFTSGTRLTAEQIADGALELWRLKMSARPSQPAMPWIVFTGGEPMLQLDEALVAALRAKGWKLAIETNGSRAIPDDWKLDWIVVSPKVAEHAIRQTVAHEARYVRGWGQALPNTRVVAERYFISPAFDGTDLDAKTLDYCKKLIACWNGEPRWELSVQAHKLAGVR